MLWKPTINVQKLILRIRKHSVSIGMFVKYGETVKDRNKEMLLYDIMFYTVKQIVEDNKINSAKLRLMYNHYV